MNQLKLISQRVHTILDYLTVVAFAAAPFIFGLEGAAAILSFGLAVAHLGVTILTETRILPNKFHGAIELTVGVALAVGPWLTPMLGGAQLLFSIAGGAILLVWLLSDYAPLTPSSSTTHAERLTADAARTRMGA